MVRAMRSLVMFALAAAVATACTKDSDSGKGFSKAAGSGSGSNATAPGGMTGSGSATKPGRKVKQIQAPFDTAKPPVDATKTASGLVFKKITTVPAGESPGKNDLVKVHYTGWKATGETMYSTTDKAGQPMQMAMQGVPPGFAEGLALMKKGEKAMLWIPPEIGYRESAKPPVPEAMAYEVELIEIVAAMPVPSDLAKPPANAQKTPLGNAFIVVKPGTGADKPRNFDTVVFNSTAWDAAGNQIESTENGPQKHPQTQNPFRTSKGLEDALMQLTVGTRARFWIPKAQVEYREPIKADGLVTIEIEVQDVQKAASAPPPVPKDVAAAPADAKKTARGVMYKVLKKGKSGAKKPVQSDTVSVHYTGWTTDGRMFDSSIIRGKPTEFPLTGVIQGWTEGLQQQSVGETVRYWIPESLAYQGRPGKPAGMLVFDVELLEIKAPPPPAPPAPADVAAPPADAKKSPKGVSYKVLKSGKPGGKQPGPTDQVKVHYSGWTTDGKLFDSSVPRGEPAEFPLNRVIAGWTDGLQLMKVGDSFRFWIPVELAYNNAPGKPAGMLVFDVELLEVMSAP
jgi:FKBP-type peptidyl-prolyl cis-trans isomerase